MQYIRICNFSVKQGKFLETPVEYHPTVSGGTVIVLTYDYPTDVTDLQIVICVPPGWSAVFAPVVTCGVARILQSQPGNEVLIAHHLTYPFE
jgi:hypothetical protein